MLAEARRRRAPAAREADQVDRPAPRARPVGKPGASAVPGRRCHARTPRATRFRGRDGRFQHQRLALAQDAEFHLLARLVGAQDAEGVARALGVRPSIVCRTSPSSSGRPLPAGARTTSRPRSVPKYAPSFGVTGTSSSEPNARHGGRGRPRPPAPAPCRTVPPTAGRPVARESRGRWAVRPGPCDGRIAALTVAQVLHLHHAARLHAPHEFHELGVCRPLAAAAQDLPSTATSTSPVLSPACSPAHRADAHDLDAVVAGGTAADVDAQHRALRTPVHEAHDVARLASVQLAAELRHLAGRLVEFGPRLGQFLLEFGAFGGSVASDTAGANASSATSRHRRPAAGRERIVWSAWWVSSTQRATYCAST